MKILLSIESHGLFQNSVLKSFGLAAGFLRNNLCGKDILHLYSAIGLKHLEGLYLRLISFDKFADLRIYIVRPLGELFLLLQSIGVAKAVFVTES